MYGLESSVNLECKRLCKRLHRLDEKSVKERGFISCHFQFIDRVLYFFLFSDLYLL